MQVSPVRIKNEDNIGTDSQITRESTWVYVLRHWKTIPVESPVQYCSIFSMP